MRKGTDYEISIIGKEPIWTNSEKLSNEQILSKVSRAVNWYNYFCEEDDYKEFVVDYCKQDPNISKEILSHIKDIDKRNPLFQWIGPICRIKTLGGRVIDKDQQYFDAHYAELLRKASSDMVEVIESIRVTPRSTSSVQLNIKNKINDTLSILESKLDEFVESTDYKTFLKSFNIETWIGNNKLKAYECQAIHDYYSDIIKEKKEALTGKDPQLNEAYDYMGKVKLKKFVELLTTIIEVSGQYALQKKQRKPRKKKKKSAEKLIQKLKYQLEDKDLGLTSIDPRDIIGAKKLIVYNTKYATICIFESDCLDGFVVKGTTIRNVTKGVRKIVRKPKEFFNSISGGIRSIINHYDGLTTKENEATPRINENTILVKITK